MHAPRQCRTVPRRCVPAQAWNPNRSHRQPGELVPRQCSDLPFPILRYEIAPLLSRAIDDPQGFRLHDPQLPLPLIALAAGQTHVIELPVCKHVVETRCPALDVMELRSQRTEPQHLLVIFVPYLADRLREIIYRFCTLPCG